MTSHAPLASSFGASSSNPVRIHSPVASSSSPCFDWSDFRAHNLIDEDGGLKIASKHQLQLAVPFLNRYGARITKVSFDFLPFTISRNRRVVETQCFEHICTTNTPNLTSITARYIEERYFPVILEVLKRNAGIKYLNLNLSDLACICSYDEHHFYPITDLTLAFKCIRQLEHLVLSSYSRHMLRDRAELDAFTRVVVSLPSLRAVEFDFAEWPMEATLSKQMLDKKPDLVSIKADLGDVSNLSEALMQLSCIQCLHLRRSRGLRTEGIRAVAALLERSTTLTDLALPQIIEVESESLVLLATSLRRNRLLKSFKYTSVMVPSLWNAVHEHETLRSLHIGLCKQEDIHELARVVRYNDKITTLGHKFVKRLRELELDDLIKAFACNTRINDLSFIGIDFEGNYSRRVLNALKRTPIKRLSWSINIDFIAPLPHQVLRSMLALRTLEELKLSNFQLKDPTRPEVHLLTAAFEQNHALKSLNMGNNCEIFSGFFCAMADGLKTHPSLTRVQMPSSFLERPECSVTEAFDRLLTSNVKLRSINMEDIGLWIVPSGSAQTRGEITEGQLSEIYARLARNWRLASNSATSVDAGSVPAVEPPMLSPLALVPCTVPTSAAAAAVDSPSNLPSSAFTSIHLPTLSELKQKMPHISDAGLTLIEGHYQPLFSELKKYVEENAILRREISRLQTESSAAQQLQLRIPGLAHSKHSCASSSTLSSSFLLDHEPPVPLLRHEDGEPATKRARTVSNAAAAANCVAAPDSTILHPRAYDELDRWNHYKQANDKEMRRSSTIVTPRARPTSTAEARTNQKNKRITRSSQQPNKKQKN